MPTRTTDYNIFKKIENNRALRRAHIRSIKKSIQENDYLHLAPILVDESMGIIDGQHRLEAARELGVPVYYEVVKEDARAVLVSLNQAQKGWACEDYFHHYRGTDETVDFLITIHEKHRVSFAAICSVFLTKDIGSTWGATFKKPLRLTKDREVIETFFSHLKEIAGSIWGGSKVKRFFRSSCFLRAFATFFYHNPFPST